MLAVIFGIISAKYLLLFIYYNKGNALPQVAMPFPSLSYKSALS
jgi:hypothetical protein